MVKETDYSEIVAMEQELIADGMPASEIACMCDLHSQVTRDVMVQFGPPPLPAGHPADTLRRENVALRDVLTALRAALAAGDQLAQRAAYNDLTDVEKHYQRKENCFFPKLEAHGITGPSKVMWAKHDEIRGLIRDFGAALKDGEKVAAAVEEMIYKEENILLPMCLDAFTEDDWAEIWHASPRYGWCLVAPREGYQPAAPVLKDALNLPATEAVQLPTGQLSLEQLLAIFNTLPVDLTFVDADDRVAFFSEGPDRVFARSRAILGRKVQNCHPPKSVHIVDQIIADFRAARQNVAEFWIELHGKFVHIRYFAVRNERGEYLGTLEVTQEVSRIRALTGERRLLEYESAPPTPSGPAWLREDRIVLDLDVDPMLAQGVHPAAQVQQAAAKLASGDIIRLKVGFFPAPLVDLVTRQGLTHYAAEPVPGRHEIYFCRLP
jgi:DUF438 domain-containing protein